MHTMQEPGKILVVMGIALVVIGLMFWAGARLPFPGRLPGDILIQRKNLTVYVPLATSLVVSFLISFIAWLWSRR